MSTFTFVQVAPYVEIAIEGLAFLLALCFAINSWADYLTLKKAQKKYLFRLILCIGFCFYGLSYFVFCLILMGNSNIFTMSSNLRFVFTVINHYSGVVGMACFLYVLLDRFKLIKVVTPYSVWWDIFLLVLSTTAVLILFGANTTSIICGYLKSSNTQPPLCKSFASSKISTYIAAGCQAYIQMIDFFLGTILLIKVLNIEKIQNSIRDQRKKLNLNLKKKIIVSSIGWLITMILAFSCYIISGFCYGCVTTIELGTVCKQCFATPDYDTFRKIIYIISSSAYLFYVIELGFFSLTVTLISELVKLGRGTLTEAEPGLIKSYFRQIIKKVLERKHGAIADSSKANTSVHQPTILLQVTDFKSTENDEFKDFLESKDDFLSSEI